MRRVFRGSSGRNERMPRSTTNQIVIIGANDIGVHLAHALGQEDQNTFLIDEGEEFLQKLDEEVDVLAISGNPISLETLRDAGIGEQSRLIAVTSSDQLNLLLLFLGKNLGIKEGYALINEQEYYHSFNPTINSLGSNLHVINLWETVIHRIERKANLESQTVYSSIDGKSAIIAVRFYSGHPYLNKRIGQIRVGSRSKILQLIKKGRLINDFVRQNLEVGDILLIRVDVSEQIPTIGRLVSFDNLQKVMVGGDGFLQILHNHWPNFTKKLVCIEKDYHKCQKMLKLLENGLIFHGDGLDLSLLNEAGIGEAKMFIAASENDEVNLLSSLLARSFGVEDILTILHKRQHSGMLERLKLNGIISIPQLVVEYLLSRILPDRAKGSMHFEVKKEREQLSDGLHLVFRGGGLVTLAGTSKREGEDVITIQLRSSLVR